MKPLLSMSRYVVVWISYIVLYAISAQSLALNENIDIPYTLSYLEDPDSVITLDGILANPNDYEFQDAKKQNNFGVSLSSFWFRLNIPAQAEAMSAILEISYPLLDIVDIHTLNDNIWETLAIGDTRPMVNREIDHYNFLKSLQLKAGEAQQVYIKIKTLGPSNIPIKLWENAAFYKNNGNNNLLMGLYYGVLFAVVLFNLSIFFSTRDRSYLYYVGYIGFIGLFLMTLDGLILKYLVPDHHLISSRIPFATLCIAMLFGFKFASTINNTAILAPGLVKVFNYFSLLLASVVFIGFFIGVRFLSIVTPFLAVVALAMYVHSIIVGIRSGYRISILVGFTFLAIIPGGVFYGIKPFGLIEHGAWLDHAFPFGVAVDAVLLSMVLSYRVKKMQSSLDSAKQKMSDARENFSRKLIDSRDQERKQLAADLHDGLGQNLLVIKNKLMRGFGTEKENDANLQSAHEIVQSTIDDIRSLSHHLHPHMLDRLGLREAIIANIEEAFSDTGIAYSHELEELHLPKQSPLALHLYRITQESIKNILTHAPAESIHFKMARKDDNIELIIEDFPIQQTSLWLDQLDFSQSFGLSSIKERVELLLGKTMFLHNTMGGLRIEVEVPYNNDVS